MKSEWNEAPLIEVAELKPNKREVRQNVTDETLVSFVPMDCLNTGDRNLATHEARSLSDVYKSYTYFKDGDVLLAKITPCFENGKLGVARDLKNGIGFGSSEFFVIRPGKRILHDYICYYLDQQCFRDAGKRVMTGAVGHKRVPREFLETHPIPLPPLEEQRRIVAVLDDAFEGLDRARAHAEANLHNASELFEIIVDQAFAENEWRTAELGKIVHDECSLSYGIVQPGEEVNGGLPIVRPTDMTKRVIDLGGLKRIDPSRAASYKRTILVGGELLVCVRGTTGMVSIANDKLSGANVTRGIVPIRFDPSKFNAWFAYHQFCSKYIREQIEEKTYGAALMQINIRDIRKISILCPSLEIQTTVVKKLDSVMRNYDQLCSELHIKLSAIADLRQSLLQRAFTGELT